MSHVMCHGSFKKLVKETTEQNALEFLKHHIKSKGKEIVYNKIELKHYLASTSSLTLQEKKEVFKIRTRMTEVKSNFKNKYENLNCDKCEQKNQYIEETQEHMYNCIEHKENKEIFEGIFKDTYETKTMKEITKRFLSNMKQKKEGILKE